MIGGHDRGINTPVIGFIAVEKRLNLPKRAQHARYRRTVRVGQTQLGEFENCLIEQCD